MSARRLTVENDRTGRPLDGSTLATGPYLFSSSQNDDEHEGEVGALRETAGEHRRWTEVLGHESERRSERMRATVFGAAAISQEVK